MLYMVGFNLVGLRQAELRSVTVELVEYMVQTVVVVLRSRCVTIGIVRLPVG
jgi:hypothetical protein